MHALALTILAASTLGQSEPTEMRLMRMPDVHGETVVFMYAGDLWSSNLEGGVARRLTTHPGLEARPKISPDGKWIAFTGEYDGNPDVFVIPIEGGEPKRLTFEPGPDQVIDWISNDRIGYKSNTGCVFVPRLWFIDINSGMPQRTKVEEIGDGSFSADGTMLAYNRSTSHQFNWRRYRGGTQGKISFFDLKTNAYSEIPANRENSWFPMYAGKAVYYVSDKNQNTVNLYRYDTANKSVKQVTTFGDADIRWPATDGKTIVYERDGYLYRFDLASSKIDKITPRIISDFYAYRPQLRNVGGAISGISISPSGNRVAVEARGEIFSLPARNGETRNMTESGGSRERMPAWSNDGKQIAYVSDASGEMQVYVQPQMGGTPTQLTNEPGLTPTSLAWSPDGKYLTFTTRNFRIYTLDVETKALTLVREPKTSGNTSYDWSPDSQWIAYIDGTPAFLDAVWLYEVKTGKRHMISDGFYSDGDVAFDSSGKYLFFLSDRTFVPTFGTFEFSLKVSETSRIYAIPLSKDTANPLVMPGDEEPGGLPAASAPAGGDSKAVKIDLEGMMDRAIPLPMPASNYAIITGLNNGVLFASGEGIFQFNMGAPAPTPIVSGPIGGQISFNPSKTKFAYYIQGQLGIANLAPGFQVGQGRVSTSNMTMQWSPRDEWKQMFWETWRFQRDNFYDKNMLGLNWKAIGDRYAKYVPYINHKMDFNYVIGMLIGELGTGHAYVSGGENINPTTNVPTGMLGADYEAAGQYVKFARIYAGRNYEESNRGPLAEPGLNVKAGDYLLEIDGKPVRSNANLHAHLVGKLGRTVVLTINDKPSMEGSRKIRVRPIANEQPMRYATWVDDNRKLVAKMSNGRIGYMHIPNTAFEGAVEMVRGFYSQADKDAVLVDERFNGGGYIQPWFVETLARRTQAWIQQRHFSDSPEASAMEGPKALLINGYAGSGGDFFPWMFKQNKLGPLIGMRTWGGLVGISGTNMLLDGTGVTSPEFGIYDHRQGKWIAENTGVDPDMEVDARPDLLAKGQDPQLEVGVKYLLDELAKKPRPALKRPDFIKAPPQP